ncbi:MAG: hypothetical protein IIV87_05425 [Oscillospiraceae bacterium]|nr:hypothetical protein [Oscillospiraceae bacterium]
MRYDLNGTWKLDFTMPKSGEPVCIEANVPGNVELALQANGLLGDYLPADDLHATSAFDTVDDWTYTCTFDAPKWRDGERCELVFEGIDTIAQIFLNSELVAESLSMHMTHRIDVTERLEPRNNVLTVIIRSAYLWAKKFDEQMPMNITAPNDEWRGAEYLRKAKHSVGWDNAPRLMTSGIWRPVYLEVIPAERLEQVYFYTVEVREDVVEVGMRWRFATPNVDLSDYTIRYTLEAEGTVIYQAENELGGVHGHLRGLILNRKDVRLWWPRGFGEPFLHDLKVEVLHCGKVVSTWQDKWGIRTIRLVRTPDLDENGNGEFQFYVNNERIFAIGTNWKPLDPLHSQADAKLPQALQLLEDMHCNMVRVWGGGIYEPTEFYDYCDRHGIMVWQDFMFACEVPPEEDWFLKLTFEESRQAIEKYRNHASLAVWCGDNENDMVITRWNRNSRIVPSKNRVTRVTLDDCTRQFDPYRDYVESSPYYSENVERECFLPQPKHFPPEVHMYPPLELMAKQLRTVKYRFIGEVGPNIVPFTMNPAFYEREKARMQRLWNKKEEDITYFLDVHQADSYFIRKRDGGAKLCKMWFGRDFSFAEYADYAFGINIITAHTYKEVIEYCRTERWNKTGVLWWSVLDMWPMAFNYSVVDSDFIKKLPYYWIRQAQQPLALMALRKELGGSIGLYYANDTMQARSGAYHVWAYDQDGNKREVLGGRFDAGKNASALIAQLPDTEKTELYLIEWEDEGEVHYNHFATADQYADIAVWQKWQDVLAELYEK